MGRFVQRRRASEIALPAKCQQEHFDEKHPHPSCHPAKTPTASWTVPEVWLSAPFTCGLVPPDTLEACLEGPIKYVPECLVYF